jgi:ribonucleoside-diphosphate reductase alpha chain
MDESTKKIFLTAYEMDMRDLVDAAADRTPFIDQGQSLNFFFASPVKDHFENEELYTKARKDWIKYVNAVHIHAWKKGLKSVYYCRSKAPIKADLASRTHKKTYTEKEKQACSLANPESCQACEG